MIRYITWPRTTTSGVTSLIPAQYNCELHIYLTLADVRLALHWAPTPVLLCNDLEIHTIIFN